MWLSNLFMMTMIAACFFLGWTTELDLQSDASIEAVLIRLLTVGLLSSLGLLPLGWRAMRSDGRLREHAYFDFLACLWNLLAFGAGIVVRTAWVY